MKTRFVCMVFVCLALVACLLFSTGCGFHYNRVKTPEGGVDESISLDLLQTGATVPSDLFPAQLNTAPL